jgi:hypothetical protein
VAQQKLGLAWILGVQGAGLSQDPTHIHAGKNSGHQAVGLSYLFGARRLLLLGFDFMLGPRGEKHHHGNHPPGLPGGPRKMDAWVQDMAAVAKDLDRAGVKVWNASRRTAIKSFPRVTLETALHEIGHSERG